MSYVGLGFGSGSLPSVYRKHPGGLARAWLLGIPVEPLCLTTELEVTQSQFWKLHLVTRDIQLELYLHHYLAILFRLPSYMDIF